jgi:hypothetical protein
MEHTTNRQPVFLVSVSMLIGMGLGGLAAYLFLGRASEGVSFGTLLGLAIGGMLTRQARPSIALLLLALLLGAIALIIFLSWRAAGA